ncbi:peroxisomal nicotinamide adenine dinucleotide carrier-like isoform X2 [Quercus suber]|uniref:peroxisomal nicotinamide adenine dinucleotide carrier-like isoform X2 n=1 Tax=Quercus suber TaxID=58331 RepID=UPI0032DEE58B
MLTSLWVAALSGGRIQKPQRRFQPDQSQMLSVDPNKTILDASELPPYGTNRAIQEVFDEAGVWGFWKGVFPTLFMVSNPSIQFMLYETMLKKLKKRRALNRKGDNGVTAVEIFLLGALAKLRATIVTYRLLVVKSRLQVRQVSTGDKRHHYKGILFFNSGTLDAVLKMIRYEGFYGFYKGMSTKIVQSVLAAAVLFMFKEELVKGARFLLTKDASAVKSKPL